MSNNFEVIVGNVGTVYNGSDRETAVNTYKYYVKQSNESAGRASGEDVTLLNGSWSELEHIGKYS